MRLLTAAFGLAATLSLATPLVTAGYACPTDGALHIQRADLGSDGEIRAIEHLEVGAHGRTCAREVDADPDDLDVAVSILHTDDAGRSLEASELTGSDPVTTHVRVNDRSVRVQTLTHGGSDGHASQAYPVGILQRVQITLSYPAGWEVVGPTEPGTSLRVEGDQVVASRSGMVLSGLLEDHLAMEMTAIPGQGTPSVTVETTPVTSIEDAALPDALLDQDTTAVVGALLAHLSDSLDGMAEGTDALEHGVATLDDGVGSLAGGAADLATGTDEFHDGVASLSDGADDLADNAGRVSDGTRELARGITALADGAGTLDAGLDDAADGAGELAGGADGVAGGLGQVTDGIGPLRDGATALAAGARQLADELASMGDLDLPETDLLGADPDELVDVVRDIADAITTVRDDLQAMVGALDPDHQQLVEVAVSILTSLADGLEELASGIATALTTLGEVAEGLATVTGAVDELAGGGEQLAAGIAELEDALVQLRQGADALAQGTGELSLGLGALSSGTNQLTTGLEELDHGADELARGVETFADGSRLLADGTRDLETGAGELAGGTSALAEGTGELAAGTEALVEGTGELSDGAAQLPDALREIGGTADRGTERVALTAALLDASAERAAGRLHDATAITTQLVHAGVPAPGTSIWLVATIAVVALVLALGTYQAARRRRSAR